MIDKALEAIRRARGTENTKVLDEAYEQALAELPLAALRKACNLTQAEMAERLGNTQAAVSKLEGRSDFLCSTLFRYARSLGAKVDLSISVGGETFSIEQRQLDEDLAFVLVKPAKPNNAEKNNVIEFKRRQLTPVRPAAMRDRSSWAHVDVRTMELRTDLFEACR